MCDDVPDTLLPRLDNETVAAGPDLRARSAIRLPKSRRRAGGAWRHDPRDGLWAARPVGLDSVVTDHPGLWVKEAG